MTPSRCVNTYSSNTINTLIIQHMRKHAHTYIYKRCIHTTPTYHTQQPPQQHPLSPYLPAALTNASNLLIDHASGVFMYTRDNRRIMDLTCGIGVTNLGHCHPLIEQYVSEQ